MIGAVVVIAVPLTWGTLLSAYEQQIVNLSQPVAEEWAATEGWIITDVSYRQGQLQVSALGSAPEADAAAFRADLDAAGLDYVDANLTLVIGGSKVLPGQSWTERDKPPGQ